jgi:hypothetical protein
MLAFQKSIPGLFLKWEGLPSLLMEPIFRNMEEFGILQIAVVEIMLGN